MNQTTFVYADIRRTPHLVGRLWTRLRNNKESASFEYDPGWLSNLERFALEPALTLGPGPFHTSVANTLFGAIGDSAPDRWGRLLMRRAERRQAEQEERAPRTLGEIDFLLRVNDEARLGALRFSREAGGAFLAEPRDSSVPPLIQLARLVVASQHVLDDTDTEDDLRLLLAPGSSLGGARPKASVRDREGQLMIAKFPAKQDSFNTVLWEALALTLAKKAGVATPLWKLEEVGKKKVLLLRRFDRVAGMRIPFLSAMSMLGAKDNEPRSYLEIVDALLRYGSAPQQDTRELWRRMVFNILVSNTDDHLRNHGFLYSGAEGWKLAPAYDLNPTPVDIKPRVLTTSVTLDDGTASLELAYEVAEYFHLNAKAAHEIAREVGKAVGGWRLDAAKLKIPKPEIDRMTSAFEHADLRAASLR